MKIRALAFKIGEAGKEIEIENGLRSFQEFVGGCIECPSIMKGAYDLVCNEEGLFTCKPNRHLPELQTMIRGDFFITKRDGKGGHASLDDMDIQALKIYERIALHPVVMLCD